MTGLFNSLKDLNNLVVTNNAYWIDSDIGLIYNIEYVLIILVFRFFLIVGALLLANSVSDGSDLLVCLW